MNRDRYPNDVALARMNQALHGARKVGHLPAKIILRTRPVPNAAFTPVPQRDCDCCGLPIPGKPPEALLTVDLCSRCRGKRL